MHSFSMVTAVQHYFLVQDTRLPLAARLSTNLKIHVCYCTRIIIHNMKQFLPFIVAILLLLFLFTTMGIVLATTVAFTIMGHGSALD
jgi:hypothetical protein